MLIALILAQAMNLSSQQQFVRGFGAATSVGGANGTINGGAHSDAMLDLMYTQLGFTIARIGIGAGVDEYPGSTSSWRDLGTNVQNQMADCKRILKRQPNAKIFASPWSANVACKAGGTLPGSAFLTSCNTSWSTFISNAVDVARNSGCPLYAVSLQNEPDFTSTIEGMTFTAAALTSWCDVLGPILTAKTPSVLMMGPEVAQWVNFSSYVGTMSADSTCLANIGIWATHAYGTPFGSVSAPPTLNGKEIWLTEYSWFDNASNLLMTGAGGGLATAVVNHNALVTGQASAVVSWWGISNNTSQDDGLVEFGGNISKRLYVLGQWSKFVLPGYVRYGITGSPPTNVSVSMFKDPATNNVAVVAVNNQATTAALTITLDATSKCQTAIPWVTDPGNNIAQQSPVAISSHAFTYTLTASSVTTFTCNGT